MAKRKTTIKRTTRLKKAEKVTESPKSDKTPVVKKCLKLQDDADNSRDDLIDEITSILDEFIATCSERNYENSWHDDPADDELDDTSDIDRQYAVRIIQEMTSHGMDVTDQQQEMETALHSFYLNAYHDGDSQSGYGQNRAGCVEQIRQLIDNG